MIYNKDNCPDFGEIESFNAASETLYIRYVKTYEDVEREQDLKDLREDKKQNIKNEW